MKTLLLSVLALFVVVAANAQLTGTQNHNVTLTLQNALSVTLSGDVSMTFSTTGQYDAGITNSASTLTVKSNALYNVAVKAAAANFTYTGSATSANTMPASVLTVAATGTSAAAARTLSNTDQNLFTAAQGRTASTVHGITYVANPGYSYAAGAYQINVIYTATQQ